MTYPDPNIKQSSNYATMSWEIYYGGGKGLRDATAGTVARWPTSSPGAGATRSKTLWAQSVPGYGGLNWLLTMSSFGFASFATTSAFGRLGLCVSLLQLNMESWIMAGKSPVILLWALAPVEPCLWCWGIGSWTRAPRLEVMSWKLSSKRIWLKLDKCFLMASRLQLQCGERGYFLIFCSAKLSQTLRTINFPFLIIWKGALCAHGPEPATTTRSRNFPTPCHFLHPFYSLLTIQDLKQLVAVSMPQCYNVNAC